MKSVKRPLFAGMKSVKDCWLVGRKVLNLKTTVCCNGQVALVFAIMQLHIDTYIYLYYDY